MKRRVGIYGGTVLALVVLWGYMVYVPYQAKARLAETQGAETQRQLREVEQFTLQLPVFLQDQQELDRQRIDLESKLYAKADVLMLLADLRLQASEFGVRVEEMSPPIEELLVLNETVARNDSPQFLNVEIILSGDYVALGRFVQRLEQSEYTRGINRCVITGARDGTEPLQMQLGFRALLGSTGGDV